MRNDGTLLKVVLVLGCEICFSGARRFVVLDFGKPILLTDAVVPGCSDLQSLSIDVWTLGEDVDGHRLVVANDIGLRSLILNDLSPPPLCRYMKVRQYNDIGPNQYYDIGPNQYNDIGPNQYYDIRPNQYNDIGPNQYNDIGPNQYYDIGPNKYDIGPNQYNNIGPNQYKDIGLWSLILNDFILPLCRCMKVSQYHDIGLRSPILKDLSQPPLCALFIFC